MELMFSVIVLVAVYVGFKMGKNEPIVNIGKMKRAVRSEEEEAKVEERLKGRRSNG